MQVSRGSDAKVPVHGAQIQQYLGKIIGPLLDRINLQIEAPAVPYQEVGAR